MALALSRHDASAYPVVRPMLLDREELIEQAYFFQAMRERNLQNLATQDLLASIREELLSTTKLPMAIDFMAAELRLHGVMTTAMRKLPHYFTPFQTFVIGEAERDGGRFDLSVGLEILERESRYRAGDATPQGVFVFQFETLCRNRLGYDKGLDAIAGDPIFNADWQEWIQTVRRQIGLVDLADLIYVRSQHYQHVRSVAAGQELPPERPILFGAKEGKIALANRHKEPLLLFAALERHLGYPTVPRLKPSSAGVSPLPALIKRVERLELRLKLVEEEEKGGIDLSKFYGGKIPPLND